DLEKLAKTQTGSDELLQVIKHVHPWSSLHFGLTAAETTVRLCTKTLPGWLGKEAEIQVLTPQVRGTLGTLALNARLQQAQNPPATEKPELRMGDRILRIGDRVIQTRNNYDLGIFNGDIGRITSIDPEEMTCEVLFSGGEDRRALFERNDLSDLSLAYA